MKQNEVGWLVRSGMLAATVAIYFPCCFAQSGQRQPATAFAPGTSRSPDWGQWMDATASTALIHGRSIVQVAISPDGKLLAWIESSRGGTEIEVAPLSDLNKSLHVTASSNGPAVCEEYGLAWAPHGDAVAFFSDCAQPHKQADLYLSHLNGDASQRLTRLKGRAGDPAFSPDGDQIAFLLVEGSEGRASEPGGTQPGNGAMQRIALVRAKQAKGDSEAPIRLVSPDDLQVYEFDWAPDGLSMAYVASEVLAPAHPCGSRLLVEQLAGADRVSWPPADQGRAPRALVNLDGSEPSPGPCRIAGPRWSPDGRQIAFLGTSGESRETSAWTVDAEGGRPRNLSQGRPTSAGWVEWEGQDHLFVNEIAGGNTQLLRYRLPKEMPDSNSAVSFGAPIFSIPGTVDDGRMCFSLSATQDHSLFVFRSTSMQGPQEIYGAKPGVVMSAGLEGVLHLSHSDATLEPAENGPILTLWSSEKYRAQEWRCRPMVRVRRRIAQ